MRTSPFAFRHALSIKTAILMAALAATLPAAPAFADGIDALKGQFAFNWFANPAKAKCAAVDDKRMAQFKSPDFTCDLNPITNTASGKPARVCSEAGEKSEYLIFASRSDCEEERQIQESNSEE